MTATRLTALDILTRCQPGVYPGGWREYRTRFIVQRDGTVIAEEIHDDGIYSGVCTFWSDGTADISDPRHRPGQGFAQDEYTHDELPFYLGMVRRRGRQ